MAFDTASTTAPAPPQVARTTSASSVPNAADFSYPRGHLGHLNETELAALEEFKSILEERGYWKSGPPPSHDDTILLYVDQVASYHPARPPSPPC